MIANRQKILTSVLIIIAIIGWIIIVVPGQTQEKAVKAVTNITRIDFSPSDAAKMATINLSAEAQIQQINQARWNKLNDILKPYKIPEGWELIKDDQGNWIGAAPIKTEEKKP